VKFGDLVSSDLGVSVLVPGENALERQVTGSYITDLPDPSRFLSVGDVVLTSGLWVARPGGSETFLGALARQRVAAVIVGLIEIGSVPDEVIALCRENKLTLATIPENVSFKTLSEAIAKAQPGSTTGLLARGIRFNHQLTDVLARGGGAASALQLFRDEFSVDSWVVDDVGSVIASVGSAPERIQVAKVWNTVMNETDANVLLVPDSAERPFSAWPITVAGNRAAGHLVCWGDHRSFSPEVSIVIDALLGALRVELDLSGRWRDSHHSHVSELVQVLIDDSVSPGEISARMRLEGLDPQLPTSVVVAEVDDAGFPPAAVLEMAYRMFSSRTTHVIGCVIDGRAVLLVSGSDEEGESYSDAVVRLADDYLPFLDGRQLRMGVSDPIIGVSSLSSGIAVARARLDKLSGTGAVLLSSVSSVSTHRELLAMLGDRTRATFAQDVLSPLTAYDSKNGSDLVGTLRAFLDNGGAWTESARQLHLHSNTLRYRIGRIEDLTHRDLSTMADRVDLYLALASVDDQRPPVSLDE
jgi:hypothetical protein